MWLYGWFFVEQPIFDAYVLGNQKPPSCYQIIWSFQRSGIVRQNESAWAQLHCSHYILWVLSIKKLTIFNDSPVHQPLIPHNRFNLATPHVCLLLLLPLRVYPKVQASLVDVLNIMPFVAHFSPSIAWHSANEWRTKECGLCPWTESQHIYNSVIVCG